MQGAGPTRLGHYRTTRGPSSAARPELPRQLFRYILVSSARHQLALSLLTIAVFLLELLPLELQRRIVNALVDKSDYSLVILLGGAYLATTLGHGSIKLALNVYRSWVGERATRALRRQINALIHRNDGVPRRAEADGVGVVVMIA
jgi:hypothetical protein